MHAVAERSSGAVAAFFCCAERFTALLLASSGSVATATTNAVPKSGARIIGSPSPVRASHSGGGRHRSRVDPVAQYRLPVSTSLAPRRRRAIIVAIDRRSTIMILPSALILGAHLVMP